VIARREAPMRSRSRLTRCALCCLAALAGIGVLLWIDPLSDIAAHLRAVNTAWVIAAIGVEVGSCVSYVALYRRLFETEVGRAVAKPAWIGLGAASVMPGGNVSGAALSAVLLSRKGASTRSLVERTSLLLMLFNGFCLVATALAATLLLSGVATGPHDILRAGLPLVICVVAAVLVIAANEGVQEQSKRHAYLLSLLGVQQFCVVVNKMDLADYSEARFREIETNYREILTPLNLKPDS